MKHEFLEWVKKKKQSFQIFVLVLIAVWMCFFIYHDLKVRVIPHYVEFAGVNIDDLILFVLGTLAVQILVIYIPVTLILNRQHNRLHEIISSLSTEDFQKLIDVNERLNWVHKYWPPFILKEKSLYVVNILHCHKIIADEIISVDLVNLPRYYFRGLITIMMKNRRFSFTVPPPAFVPYYLIIELLRMNPSIKVNDNLEYIRKYL